MSSFNELIEKLNKEEIVESTNLKELKAEEGFMYTSKDGKVNGVYKTTDDAGKICVEKMAPKTTLPGTPGTPGTTGTTGTPGTTVTTTKEETEGGGKRNKSCKKKKSGSKKQKKNCKTGTKRNKKM